MAPKAHYGNYGPNGPFSTHMTTVGQKQKDINGPSYDHQYEPTIDSFCLNEASADKIIKTFIQNGSYAQLLCCFVFPIVYVTRLLSVQC